MAPPRSASPTAGYGTRSPSARTRTGGARPSTTSSARWSRLAQGGSARTRAERGAAERVPRCGSVRPIEAKEPSGKALGRARTRSRVPDAEIAELRDVRFPTAMRGYDRDAVDRYVSRVNRVLAELQITAAPESAIRHALEQVT